MKRYQKIAMRLSELDITGDHVLQKMLDVGTHALTRDNKLMRMVHLLLVIDEAVKRLQRRFAFYHARNE